MSIVPKENIEVIAQSIGINNLSSDVALALAPDVEYRLREIMQEAIKCMRHSRRTRLTVNDVDAALDLRNVEPIYGFASGGQLRFKRAVGHRDLFYIDDKDVDFKDVIEAPLPKAPLDIAVLCHWLAIDGVQPAIPENAPVEDVKPRGVVSVEASCKRSVRFKKPSRAICSEFFLVIAPPSDGKKNEQKDDAPVDIKLPVKHVLSKELQLYFDKITELVVTKSDSVLFKEALVSLSTDSGLHPLVPYFTCFIADEVARGLNDYRLLFSLMRVVSSLLQNPHIHIEPYLHQLMPSVVTCLVAKRLGNRFAENHWELRDFTAKLVGSICKRFGHVYNTLQTRLTKTLLNAFLDPKRAMTQHYGAIQGLAALGPNVIQLLILPNLAVYLQLLEPELLLEKQKNEMKRYEAWRVYGALLRAAGLCIYDRLKIFPPLRSPSPRALWKENARVAITAPNKRKGITEDTDQQPSPKKMEIDGPVSEPSSNSTQSHLQGETTAIPNSVDTNAPSSSSSSSIRMSDENVPNSRGTRNRSNDRYLKSMAVLKQIWKDDLNSGQLLASLFELFGEDILSFIPSPEMSLFL